MNKTKKGGGIYINKNDKEAFDFFINHKNSV
jgi:hypothetical protein